MTNLGRVAPDAAVFGICRPGHLGASLEEWIAALEAAAASRVVRLSSETEATRRGLPGAYADRFETAHAPVRDRHLPDEAALAAALAAVREATAAGRRVAQHCNAGLGWTGVVAAAWLVRERGCDPAAAVETVEGAGRAPRKAVRCGNATGAALRGLFDG